MYANVCFSFLLHISFSPCGHICDGFLLSFAHQPLLFFSIFPVWLFLPCLLLFPTFSFSPPSPLPPPIRGRKLWKFTSFWKSTALLQPYYEQLCSSCKRKGLELTAHSKGGLLSFQKKGAPLMIHLVLAAA